MLKRAYAVADLTQVPENTPLELHLHVSIRIQDNATLTSDLVTVPIHISSLATIRQLKHQLEPHAYHHYREYLLLKQPVNTDNDNHETLRPFYTRASSPPASALVSPLSDYESETEDWMVVAGAPVFGNASTFLSSMKIASEGSRGGSGEWMDDRDYLYQLGDVHQGEGAVRCTIQLEQLCLEVDQ